MPMTKKLEKLLLKYKKANQARLRAYNRRSRLLKGVNVKTGALDCNGWPQWKRVFKVPITDALKVELDANIETARLYKLEVSKELRAYCKKKKYHIKWGDSNQIDGIQDYLSWKLRTHKYAHNGDALLGVLYALNLSKSQYFFF